MGIEYIFEVLCLMCEIMIYRLTLKYNIDSDHINKFKEELKEIKME